MSYLKNKFNPTRIISDFRKVLGEDYVQLREGSKESSYFINLFPKNTKEIQQCLKIANKYKLPLFVSSTGKNWGYNTSFPTYDYYGFLILSRFKKIIEYNEQLGYVTIEPGVTFDQLYQFLKTNKSKLMVAATGASPNTSVVAHVLERGISKGPIGTPFYQTCGYEIVLPTGEILYTDHARFTNSRTKALSNNSFGPILNGLFTQSNFGVVTQMTIWLESKPKNAQIIFYYLKSDTKLPAFIDVIRTLKIEGIITGNLLLANRYRILASMTQYPWEKTRGKTPLPQDTFSRLTKKWDWKGEWYGEILLNTSYEGIAKEFLRVLRKKLRGVVKDTIVIDGEKAKKAQSMIQIISRSNKNDDLMMINNVFFESNMLGVPTTIPLRSLYWRKKIPLPDDLDPIRDKCGIFWINTEIPFIGSEVEKVNKVSTTLMLEYGFEPNISFNLLTDRIVVLVASILYDEEDAVQRKNAYRCYVALNKRLSKLGYYPYRINPFFRHVFPKSQGDYENVINIIKKSLDPNNILSPL